MTLSRLCWDALLPPHPLGGPSGASPITGKLSAFRLKRRRSTPKSPKVPQVVQTTLLENPACKARREASDTTGSKARTQNAWGRRRRIIPEGFRREPSEHEHTCNLIPRLCLKTGDVPLQGMGFAASLWARLLSSSEMTRASCRRRTLDLSSQLSVTSDVSSQVSGTRILHPKTRATPGSGDLPAVDESSRVPGAGEEVQRLVELG